MTDLSHRITRMTGRDPNELHRGPTTLELLFDLAFVVAFGQASDQMSHLLAEGHTGPAIGGFAFAMFAICWAWINFSWFASAYDTDDWFFRVTTMVQMVGAIILALGLPAMFHSVEIGDSLGNQVMVAGYVVMRIAMVAQWWRAARQDPARRPVAAFNGLTLFGAQIGWVALAVIDPSIRVMLVLGAALAVVELSGPVLAERRASGPPWHAHHIAERYGLFTMITLGEVLFGTVASVSAIIEQSGWSGEAVIVVIAGVGLTFGLWWTYFMLPSGEILHHHRERSFVWGYGHMLLFASIAGIGAGIHVAAYVIEGNAHIGTLGAILAVAIPVLIFSSVLFGIYSYLLHEGDGFHLWLFAGVVVLLIAAVALAAAGASIGACLILVTLSPVVVVVGYETVGHRHAADALRRALHE
jgi:low temperature requirement protein LtrA